VEPPGRILILRHGEEPDESDGDSPPFGVTADGPRNQHSLTPRGWQRAGALAAAFPNGALSSGGVGAGEPLPVPDRIVALRYGDRAATKHHRAYQTVLPLAQRLSLHVETPFEKGEEAELAVDVLTTPADVTLICWESHHIPEIAGALPVLRTSRTPDRWPERYDLIWSFTRTSGGAPGYSYGEIPQLLLAGDAGIQQT
jgi:broad specificity phosphatase PhoE